MIKDEEFRNSLLKNFPALGIKEQQEVEDEYMPHYVLYKQVKRGVFECYCTHCHQFYINDTVNGRHFIRGITHKEMGQCLECGSSITFLAMGKGRKNINNKEKFAIFRAKEEKLYIRCFTVYERFSVDGLRGDFEDSDPLEFEWYELHRCCLTNKGVQHWRNQSAFDFNDGKWYRTWHPLKSENDPDFSMGAFGVYNSYTVIDCEEVEKTFLKYADECIDDYSVCLSAKRHYIKYLCEFAKHPNIEYLIKSGFGYIISQKLDEGYISGIRINYRSNDVKRMLKLNKTEMNLLKNRDCETLSAYYELRKADPSMDENTRFQAACKHSRNMCKLGSVMKKTSLSLKKVLNYADKLGYYGIGDWNDYLDQCIKLKYDMTDTLITKPKNLQKAHERLTKIIKLKADELAQQQLEERNKKLEKMRYIDEERGLQIIIPKSLQEIIDEGKRLNHCVGGYAGRHAQGKLTILFLRTTEKPDVPYYTMEISTEGQIVQCRGYKNNRANNPKPQKIIDFEKDYQVYLDTLFGKKNKKQRVRISA